jgi:hypothetical protein
MRIQVPHCVFLKIDKFDLPCNEKPAKTSAGLLTLQLNLVRSHGLHWILFVNLHD